MGKPETFDTGCKVYYPTQGVGTIIAVETATYAGVEDEFYTVTFDRGTVRIPVGKAHSNGLTPLTRFASKQAVREAIADIGTFRRKSRAMWSRRASEFKAKLNSGALTDLAAVIRDITRPHDEPLDISHSEMDILREALQRFVEVAAGVLGTTEEAVYDDIDKALKKGGKQPLPHKRL